MQTRKLGSSLRFRLSELQASEAEQPAPVLSLLVGLYTPLDEETRTAVEAINGRIRTAAGDVLTLDLPADQLAALTDLTAVRSVEISEPLFRETTDPSTGTGE